MTNNIDPAQLKNVTDLANAALSNTTFYEDTIQPVAKEVGKSLQTLGGVVNLALEPLRGMIYGYDLIKANLNKRLEEKLKDTKKENIIHPPLNVVGPLIDKYRYVAEDEELSDLFINLLANAMDKEHVKSAHPSFVDIIASLSPDEAKLIRYLSLEKITPVIDILAQRPLQPGQIPVYKHFTLFGEKAKLKHDDLVPSYIDNLIRLGLLNIPPLQAYTDKTVYEPLKSHLFVKQIEASLVKIKTSMIIKEHTIETTEFGKMFMNAVLKKM